MKLEVAAANAAVDEVHCGSADKASDEKVGGLVVNLIGAADLLDDASAHDGDAVGEGHGFDLVVGYVDGGYFELAREVLELGAHADAELGVEVGERLVHEKDFGGADDGARQGDALALAAGEFFGLALQIGTELDLLGGFAHARGDLAFGNAADFERVGDVGKDVHVRIEPVILEDHGDVAVFGQVVVDFALANEDVARARLFEAGDHAHSGGFAATRGAEQHEKFLVVDAQRLVVDADGGAPALGDVFESY